MKSAFSDRKMVAVPSHAPSPIIHAISGSLGSSISLLLLYPLERARIEFQRNATDAPRTNSSSGAEGSHHPASQRTPKERLDFLVSTTTTNEGKPGLNCPESFEFVGGEHSNEELNMATKTVLPSARPTSLTQCIRELWIQKSLYRGVMHNSLSLAISNFCFFFVNEFVKNLLRTHSSTRRHDGATTQRLRPDQYLLASCIAGVCNVLVTNPLWVSNLHIVTEDTESEVSSSSPIETRKSALPTGIIGRLLHTARTHGVAHLWSGTAVSLLLVSNPVIQFFVYEQLKQRFPISKVASQGSLRIFCMAAVAKFVATVVRVATIYCVDE